MDPHIDIRQARAGDAAWLRACAHEAYTPYVAAIGREPAPMRADFPALIAAGAVYLAVDAEAGPVGFAVFYPQGDSLFLESVAVRAAAAGKGIGKRLIGFCEAQARRRQAASVRLYTNARMTDNLSIYPHLGYRETGRRHEDGFDRVFFEKRL